MSQMRIWPSSLPVARVLSSSQTIESGSPPLQLTLCSWPLATVSSRTVPSTPAVARRLPSGDQARPWTPFWRKELPSSPVPSTLRNQTVLLPLPEAKRVPSGDQAIWLMGPLWSLQLLLVAASAMGQRAICPLARPSKVAHCWVPRRGRWRCLPAGSPHCHRCCPR